MNESGISMLYKIEPFSTLTSNVSLHILNVSSSSLANAVELGGPSFVLAASYTLKPVP
jgi:hypothetical protein